MHIAHTHVPLYSLIPIYTHILYTLSKLGNSNFNFMLKSMCEQGKRKGKGNKMREKKHSHMYTVLSPTGDCDDINEVCSSFNE